MNGIRKIFTNIHLIYNTNQYIYKQRAISRLRLYQTLPQVQY